jgi:hypothetical protein
MIRRLLIASFVLIFILGILIGIFFNSPSTAGLTVSAKNNASGTEYSYTKTICNSTKCTDVVVNCSNGNISEINSTANLGNLRNNTNASC